MTERTRVLYAPTWEGFYEDSCYCSLTVLGRHILDTLGAAPDRYVLHYKGHPLTGTSNSAYLRAQDELIARARAIGVGGLLMEPNLTLYDYFSESDLLITDISSVISDYLYLDRPVIVTNPLSIGDMEHQFPVVRGCYVLDAASPDLPSLLMEIATRDTKAEVRGQVRNGIFGVPRGSSMTEFQRHLTQLCKAAAATKPSALPLGERANKLMVGALDTLLAPLMAAAQNTGPHLPRAQAQRGSRPPEAADDLGASDTDGDEQDGGSATDGDW